MHSRPNLMRRPRFCVSTDIISYLIDIGLRIEKLG